MKQILKPKRQVDQTVLKETRQKPCVVCGKHSDPAHIKSRGAGGPDDPENLMPLCREHHTMQHAKGHVYMVDKFPPYRFYIEKLGWRVEIRGSVRMIKHPRF